MLLTREQLQEHTLALFHICQRALAIAAKHAKAKNLSNTLWTTDESLLMEIHNDGRGLEMGKMSSFIGHGLANMQTRAHARVVMWIYPLLWVKGRPFLHGFRATQMNKRRFQKFPNFESQDLETQSQLYKSISRVSLQTIPFHIYDYVGKTVN